MGLLLLDFRWFFFFKLLFLKLNEFLKELLNIVNGLFLELFIKFLFFVLELFFNGLENDVNGLLLFKLLKLDDSNFFELKGLAFVKGLFVVNGFFIVKLLKEFEWEFLVFCFVGGVFCVLILFFGGSDGVIFVFGRGRGIGVLSLMVCELYEGDIVFGIFFEIFEGGRGMEEIECSLWEEIGLGGGVGGGGLFGKGGGGFCGEGRLKFLEFLK